VIILNIVYGGSFNPPTIAHEGIISELKKEFKPENIIIIPAGNSYNRKELLDFRHRYNMLKLVSDDIISDIENKNQEYKGTLYTLDLLSKDYSNIHFVMGADNLIDIKSWIRYEELLSKYNFIIITRDDIDIKAFIDNNLSAYKSHFSFISLKYKVSSTAIRNNIEEHKNMLNPKVYEYIKKNHLYEE